MIMLPVQADVNEIVQFPLLLLYSAALQSDAEQVSKHIAIVPVFVTYVIASLLTESSTLLTTVKLLIFGKYKAKEARARSAVLSNNNCSILLDLHVALVQ